MERPDITPASGRLGVLLPGFGAVATTFVAGVEAIRQGLAEPFGSLTQMQTIRLGRRDEERTPLIKDFVDLVPLDDLVFGAWDPIPDDGYESAVAAGVLDRHEHLEPIADFLHGVEPMPAVFDTKYVKKLDGPNVKEASNKLELAIALREDIRRFKEEHGCERLVMIWCGSTEVFLRSGAAHESVESLERAMEENDDAIPPSMLYAYAAIMEGVPYANGAPNLSADVPALEELAREKGVPIGGKDFKTGQTLMKTILAPGFKTRMLGIRGWFSTNILGTRDGEVLDDPESFKVRINYYPPRGDNKEGWDNIDIFGWLGYPMQIKVDFLCRDSILAAPIVLDLALFLDLASRAGMNGVQEWLSFYFKSPQTLPGIYPEHDIFIQHLKLKNTLRWLGGEELLHHGGLEYYAE